ncbi:MAG: hypothetical protein KF746_15045 [Chitinophagaceae bacterium]|nr:hypothetical protein [Chitinophagaceae bacterium]
MKSIKIKVTTLMKQVLLIAFLLLTFFHSYSQGDKPGTISLNGFYIAKTGNIPAAEVDIYTYFRFYKDGAAYLQTVTSNDPQSVAGWFGRFKKFSQSGTYQVNGSSVSIQLGNKDSKDFKLEGLQETNYKGIIKSGNQLCLTKDNELEANCFDFSAVSDTTKLKYAQFKPEIKLPGDWKVKQILKSNGQVYLINEDSTIVAIAVFIASKLPVFKETQTNFETAYAYYDWDSKYMKDEQKMEVTKIAENKDKAFVIWNSKDPYNDNYYLFAKHESLLYNIMIFDKEMPVEKQLGFLELLYDLNKE